MNIPDVSSFFFLHRLQLPARKPFNKPFLEKVKCCVLFFFMLLNNDYEPEINDDFCSVFSSTKVLIQKISWN